MKAAALVAIALASAGCVTFSNLQRAEVLEEGQTRIGFAPIALHSDDRGAALDFEPALPFVANIRYGLGHDLEIGGRFWLAGVGIGAKYELLEKGPLTASFAPEVLAWVPSNANRNAYDFSLPVLAGLDAGEHQLILGARAVVRRWQVVVGREDWVTTTFPGAIVGFDFALPGGVHLLPEASVSYWIGGRELFWTATMGIYLDTWK